MSDDAELARVLRRFLASDEYWDCWTSEELDKAELTLDGMVELSMEEAAAVAEYRRQVDKPV